MRQQHDVPRFCRLNGGLLLVLVLVLGIPGKIEDEDENDDEDDAAPTFSGRTIQIHPPPLSADTQG